MAILTTLSTFLRCALSSEISTSPSSPPWYLARSFLSRRDYATFLANFGRAPAPTIDCRTDAPDLPVEHFGLAFAELGADLALDMLSLPSLSAGFPLAPVASTSTAPSPPPASLLTLLHPTLLSGFLDTAPAAFAPGALSFPAQERATVSAVLSVARELYARELGGVDGVDGAGGTSEQAATTRKLLVMFLGHVGPYFPFGADELGKRSEEAASQLDELNRTFCSLVSLLVLSSPDAVARVDGAGAGRQSEARLKKKKASEAKVEALIRHTREWVVSALLGELDDTILTATSYAGLEPTLWALLNMPPPRSEGEDEEMEDGEQDPAATVFAALLSHFSTASTRGDLKPRAFRFLARAVLAQAERGKAYTDRFAIPASCVPALEAWVQSLPKFLWELQAEQPTTELVLLFLLRLAQRAGAASGAVLPPSLLANLRPSLVPFFALQHPTRGTILGPFVKCDERVQALAMDVARRLDLVGDRKGGKAMREAVGRAVRSVGGDVRERWKGK